MKPYDNVKDLILKDCEMSFGKLLILRFDDKYVACDIFAKRLCSEFPERTIGNLVDNLRAFCDKNRGSL